MSFDVDEGEVQDAVERGDFAWIWSVVKDAYEQRDRPPAMLVSVNLDGVADADGFHRAFAEAFGFPSFYGRNFNAWIDCMTDLDDPGTGMTQVHVAPGQILILQLVGVARFRAACPDLYLGLLESAAFVNYRRLETGQPAVLALSYGS